MINTVECLGQVAKYTCYIFSPNIVSVSLFGALSVEKPLLNPNFSQTKMLMALYVLNYLSIN